MHFSNFEIKRDALSYVPFLHQDSGTSCFMEGGYLKLHIFGVKAHYSKQYLS